MKRNRSGAPSQGVKSDNEWKTRSGRVLKPKVFEDSIVDPPFPTNGATNEPFSEDSGSEDHSTGEHNTLPQDDSLDDDSFGNNHTSSRLAHSTRRPHRSSTTTNLHNNSHLLPSAGPYTVNTPLAPRPRGPRQKGGGIYKQAAIQVLRLERRLMTTAEIARVAIRRGFVTVYGKTPEATMASALYTDVKRKERHSVFVRPSEGMFGLREWLDAGGGVSSLVRQQQAVQGQVIEGAGVGGKRGGAPFVGKRPHQNQDLVILDVNAMPLNRTTTCQVRGSRGSSPIAPLGIPAAADIADHLDQGEEEEAAEEEFEYATDKSNKRMKHGNTLRHNDMNRKRSSDHADGMDEERSEQDQDLEDEDEAVLGASGVGALDGLMELLCAAETINRASSSGTQYYGSSVADIAAAAPPGDVDIKQPEFASLEQKEQPAMFITEQQQQQQQQQEEQEEDNDIGDGEATATPQPVSFPVSVLGTATTAAIAASRPFFTPGYTHPLTAKKDSPECLLLNTLPGATTTTNVTTSTNTAGGNGGIGINHGIPAAGAAADRPGSGAGTMTSGKAAVLSRLSRPPVTSADFLDNDEKHEVMPAVPAEVEVREVGGDLPQALLDKETQVASLEGEVQKKELGVLYLELVEMYVQHASMPAELKELATAALAGAQDAFRVPAGVELKAAPACDGCDEFGNNYRKNESSLLGLEQTQRDSTANVSSSSLESFVQVWQRVRKSSNHVSC